MTLLNLKEVKVNNMAAEKITIDRIAIIAKMSDGKYRQILVKKENEIDVLHAISSLSDDGSINVLEKEIEGVELLD